jgi:hypothetical protein
MCVQAQKEIPHHNRANGRDGYPILAVFEIKKETLDHTTTGESCCKRGIADEKMPFAVGVS